MEQINTRNAELPVEAARGSGGSVFVLTHSTYKLCLDLTPHFYKFLASRFQSGVS